MAKLSIDRLVAQMADAETSWEAHREVEKLADVTAVPPLVERIAAERDRSVKENLYFMLGHIGRNTGDVRVAEALLSRLAVEADEYLLGKALEALERQPQVPDCRPVLPLAGDPRWQVRHAALSVLGSCASPRAEEALLEVLDASEEVHDLVYAAAALGKVGTPRAVPALTRLALRGPSEDVKTSALAALTKIGDASLLPVFLEALADRNAHVRGYAMAALARHGDERAVSPVIDRVTQIVSRERKQKTLPSELIRGLEFLLRYAATDARIPALLRTIQQKRRDRLFPEEQRWMEEHEEAWSR